MNNISGGQFDPLSKFEVYVIFDSTVPLLEIYSTNILTCWQGNMKKYNI